MNNNLVQDIGTVLGRIMIATIFLISAVGNKIPNFNKVAGYMASERASGKRGEIDKSSVVRDTDSLGCIPLFLPARRLSCQRPRNVRLMRAI